MSIVTFRGVSVVAVLAMACALVAGPAKADGEVGPTQRAAYFKALNEEYGDELKDLNTNAGLSGDKAVMGGYLDKTFPDSTLSYGGSYGMISILRGGCTAGAHAVRDIVVNTPAGKAGVVAKIKRIDCSYGGKSKDKLKVNLEGSHLTFFVTEDTSGATVAEAVTNYLNQKL